MAYLDGSGVTKLTSAIKNLADASYPQQSAIAVSFNPTYLEYIKNYDDQARLGFLSSTYSSSDITTCTNLKTTKNNVFYDVSYGEITQAICDAFSAEDISVEAWTVNDASVILGLNKYVSGITSDSLIAGKVLYDNTMNNI